MIYEKEIDARYLKALLLITPAKDERFYLNGIRVKEFRELQATNGVCAGVIPLPDCEKYDFDFTIPRSAVAVAVKNNKHPTVVLSFDTSTQKGALSTPTNITPFKAIDGKYPDLTPTLHGKEHANRQAGNYDFRLLAAFQDMADLFAPKGARTYARVIQNGAGRGYVEIGAIPGFAGVIGSLRF